MTYRGVCIGGPLDGQTRRAEQPRMEAAMPLSAPFSFAEIDEAVSVERQTMTYRYEDWRTAKETFGMWVPVGTPLETALAELFRTYREAKAK